MTKLSEMLEAKEKLDAEIHELRAKERSEAIAKVRALMGEYGLVVQDLGLRNSPYAHHMQKPKGVPVPVKYRNAATGESWTGRGLRPSWLNAALKAGNKLEDFDLNAVAVSVKPIDTTPAAKAVPATKPAVIGTIHAKQPTTGSAK